MLNRPPNGTYGRIIKTAPRRIKITFYTNNNSKSEVKNNFAEIFAYQLSYRNESIAVTYMISILILLLRQAIPNLYFRNKSTVLGPYLKKPSRKNFAILVK